MTDVLKKLRGVAQAEQQKAVEDAVKLGVVEWTYEKDMFVPEDRKWCLIATVMLIGFGLLMCLLLLLYSAALPSGTLQVRGGPCDAGLSPEAGKAGRCRGTGGVEVPLHRHPPLPLPPLPILPFHPLTAMLCSEVGGACGVPPPPL